jgi:hypothetical protein
MGEDKEIAECSWLGIGNANSNFPNCKASDLCTNWDGGGVSGPR